MEEHYVDLRITFRKEVEDWGDGDVSVMFIPATVQRHNLTGITADDLDSIGESFGQMDSYQFMLQSDIPAALCSDDEIDTDL